MAKPAAVRVLRSGLEESLHAVHVAVCDARGRLLASAGDPDRLVFARSCMKPLQAAVSLQETGCERLSDRQVAVICASHNGEPIHVRTVRSVLRRADLGEEDLRNPPGQPIDPASRPKGDVRRRIWQDCSGKHSGMLLGCVRRGWPTETYRSPGHALQRRVLAAVRAATGVERPLVGVDGCGVPVHGVPLRAMATLYARLAEPERLGEALAPHVARATAAMRAEPYLVGGRHRVDTEVMSATDDLVVKEGAEAMDCAVSLGAGVGIAVKVGDGGYRAAGVALLHALDRLGLLDRAARTTLRAGSRPPVLGGDRPVGRLEPAFELRGRE